MKCPKCEGRPLEDLSVPATKTAPYCPHCDGIGEIQDGHYWLGLDPEAGKKFVCIYDASNGGHWLYWNWIEGQYEVADDFEPRDRMEVIR